MQINQLTEIVLSNENQTALLDQKFDFLEERFKMNQENFNELKSLILGLSKKIDDVEVRLEAKMDRRFAEMPDLIRAKVLWPLFMMFMGIVTTQVLMGPVVKKIFGL